MASLFAVALLGVRLAVHVACFSSSMGLGQAAALGAYASARRPAVVRNASASQAPLPPELREVAERRAAKVFASERRAPDLGLGLDLDTSGTPRASPAYKLASREAAETSAASQRLPVLKDATEKQAPSPGMSASRKSAAIPRTSGRGGLVHLFDSSIYIFRFYWSIPEMLAPDGTPCNAAYGLAQMLMSYVVKNDPSHAAVCLDASRKSFRNLVEPEYKMHRPEVPPDLKVQFDLCHKISDALGFKTFKVDSYEADDLLGTIADRVVHQRGRARILTADKDLCQLVREDGSVIVQDPARKETFDADAVRDKFGVSPAQIPDYLGLVGDSADNFPGVPGVGKKTAVAVLQSFGRIEQVPDTLEAVADAEVDGVKQSKLALIIEHRARALKSKKLATIVRQVPGVSPDLSDLAYHGPDRQKASELFKNLGWYKLLNSLESLSGRFDGRRVRRKRPDELRDWRRLNGNR